MMKTTVLQKAPHAERLHPWLEQAAPSLASHPLYDAIWTNLRLLLVRAVVLFGLLNPISGFSFLLLSLGDGGCIPRARCAPPRALP